MGALVLRQCAACEPELRRSPAPSARAGDKVDVDVDAAVRASQRGGEPLPQAARDFFEPRFGHNFSDVRVHASGEAPGAARAIAARAYTIGRDIVFGHGEYQPDTAAGKQLLAHELAHVVQQSAQGGMSPSPVTSVVQREPLSDDPYPGTSDGEQPALFSLSDEGFDFLKQHEGVRCKLYNDSQGHCTTGVGHLVHKGNCNGNEPANYKAGLTYEEALALFRQDLGTYEAAVANSVTSRLNQYYFDALVSFTFNVGIGGFQGSGVLREVNATNYSKVAAEMMKWVNPPELKSRRTDEANLFRTRQYPPAAADVIPAECKPPATTSPPAKIQRKAHISPPGDRFEREADEAADRVMRMAEPGATVTGDRAAVSRADLHIARAPEKPQGDPDAGAPETPIGGDATGVANSDETPVYDSSRQEPSVVETLASKTSVKVTHNAGNYYRIVTPSGKTGYVLRSQLDLARPADDDAAPAQQSPVGHQPIIDKATQGPEAVDGEQVWLLDGAYWLDLLTSIPDNQRNLGGIPIGGMTGWLHVKGKPVVVAKFGSKADGPNNTGLITYQGNFLLWRHAIHHNHNPTGGTENTGTYDAMEGYKLPADILAKYEARKKARAAQKATGK